MSVSSSVSTSPSASFSPVCLPWGMALLSLVRHVRLNLEDLLLGQVLGVAQVDMVVTVLLTVVVTAVPYGLDHLFLVLQAVGIILVISLLITPAAAALPATRMFEHAMIPSAGFGASTAVVGLYAPTTRMWPPARPWPWRRRPSSRWPTRWRYRWCAAGLSRRRCRQVGPGAVARSFP